MDFQEFAKSVDRTRNPKLNQVELAGNWALGIAGESGEIVEHVKKYLYHGKELNYAELTLEIGDLLYYVQAMCNLFGINIEDAMVGVDAKLRLRYPNGFVEGGGIRVKNNDHEDDGN
jgi:NTP pyrophosphatase (non-canonical NTP hydrolase)